MHARIPALALSLFLTPALSGAGEAPAAFSITGTPLYAPELPEATRSQYEAELAAARADFEVDPGEANTIWLGRRLAYLMRVKEAVDVFSEGLERFPDSYRLLRHRGHRHITLRDFDAAVTDLARARRLMPREPVEIEPDGRPNRLGIPLSSTQFNILYHLALAHYLKGDFAAATEAWRACLDYSTNPDLLVATSDWLYLSLRRQGLHAEAEALLANITPDLQVIENDAYLRRLRMYRGELAAEGLLDTAAEDRSLALATQGYGVATWHLVEGDVEAAQRLRAAVLDTGAWAAFGYIAAEADARRMTR
ncbi:MAG TPA: hypothetical protein PKZ76_00930 [Xanthomonadaceae bacterium]|nr:hypothetical protein [Xanthomonadaceae bacterium]